MRIRLIYDKSLEHILFAFTRPETLEELKKRKIELSLLDGDVILVLQDNRNVILNDEILSWGKPIILWERNASSKVEFVEAANDPRVVMYIKGQSVLRDLSLYDTEMPKDKYHYKLYWDVAPKKERNKIRELRRPSVLTPEAKKKLVVFYNDGLWQRSYQYTRTKIDYKAKRPCDIWFVGKVKRSGQHAYTYHRQCAVKHIKRVVAKGYKGLVSSEKIKSPRYAQGLLKSKIVVSPWGFGEVCFRDFEAVLCGCLLVKPDMGFLSTWPDIFVPNKTFIPCRADFSDLKVVACSALKRWDKMKKIRQQARNTIKEAWRPEVVADRFDSLLRKVGLK